MIIFEENEKNRFSFYKTEDLMAINGFNYKFLTETERHVLDILDEFCKMISREIVEFDNANKDIGEYLQKFNHYSGVYSIHIIFG